MQQAARKVLLAALIAITAGSSSTSAHNTHEGSASSNQRAVQTSSASVDNQRRQLSRGTLADYNCSSSFCSLGGDVDCLCANTQAPGGLAPSRIPMMVLLTWGDAVPEQIYENSVNMSRVARSANDCPIRSTYYVSTGKRSHLQTAHATFDTLQARRVQLSCPTQKACLGTPRLPSMFFYSFIV